MTQAGSLPPDEGDDGTISLDEYRARVKAAEAAAAIAVSGNRPNWMQLLQWAQGFGKQPAQPKKCMQNVLTTLQHAPEWQGVLRYNAFSDRVELAKLPPMAVTHAAEAGIGPWSDQHSPWAIAWFQERLGFEPSAEAFASAIAAVARANAYHPVRDYLNGLKWDGTPRLESMLPRLFGAPDSPVVREMGMRWMVSAIARIFRPGCQADHMLVLEGAQGTRKSTALRVLVGDDWFRNSPLDLRDKDAAGALRGCWVYEFDELESFRGREATRIKSFLSARVDSYRPPYGRHVVDAPRYCVFAGSTNEERYLVDPTGNRRFWTVRCGAIDCVALAAGRDQLWAEAMVRFQAGERWWIEGAELEAALTSEQSQREELDPWADIIQHWYLGLSDYDRRKGVTVRQVLKLALEMKGAQANRRDETRVGHILRGLQLGQRRVREEGLRERKYFDKNMPDLGWANVPGED